MVISNDLKPGMSFKYDDGIYTVLDVWQNKTAMRKMVVKVKAKIIC
jgi:translation elongation factor P/translation initiation factor 5A